MKKYVSALFTITLMAMMAPGMMDTGMSGADDAVENYRMAPRMSRRTLEVNTRAKKVLRYNMLKERIRMRRPLPVKATPAATTPVMPVPATTPSTGETTPAAPATTPITQ